MPGSASSPRVLVIGAGLAGLACAGQLAAAGAAVVVADKARGPGGRASTRRSPEGGYDHGAQYFTARDERFRHAVAGWVAARVLAPWRGRIVRIASGRVARDEDEAVRWVGTPRMSALLRHLAEPFDTRFSCRVTQVVPAASGLEAVCEDGAALGSFAAVVVATPAAQAVPLLASVPALAARAATVEVDPCFAAMLAFDEPPDLDFDGAFVEDDPVLAWAAREASKPGRAPGGRWLLHASPQASRARLESPHDAVAADLLQAFAGIAGRALEKPARVDVHRWLYARTTRPLGEAFLLDAERGLGACGDWCLGARMECAWQSGVALGEALARRVVARR